MKKYLMKKLASVAAKLWVKKGKSGGNMKCARPNESTSNIIIAL